MGYPRRADGGDNTGAIPSDYDPDPGRFAANQRATQRFSAEGDIHPLIARRLAAEGCETVLDIGGGNGTLVWQLARTGTRTVVVDRAAYLANAPRPVIFGDACQLPFQDGTFDGAAALWMLHHLADPLPALLEVRRVLRPGGLLAVSTTSRHNDSELATVLPNWGNPLTFDAENGPELLASVFDTVEIERWDRPMIRLADQAAVTLFLRGRGGAERSAHEAAEQLRTPLTVTKRGMIAWARTH